MPETVTAPTVLRATRQRVLAELSDRLLIATAIEAASDRIAERYGRP